MKGLYFAKAWFTRKLTIFVNLAVRRNLSPDLFTWIGVAGAILATVALIGNVWPLVGMGLAIRLGGANLDGAVARAQGSSSRFGFILNEVGDRLSDFILMLGLLCLAWRSDSSTALTLSIFALVASTFPTLISVSGAGAGGTRINGGPFGKTERCASIFLLSIALAFGAPQIISISLGCSLIIFGSLITALTRALTYKRILTDLEK